MANRAAALTAKYDNFSDVLYMAVEKPRQGVRYFETDEGLLLRVGPEGQPVGITVEDYMNRWESRLDELADAIAKQLHLDVAIIRTRLPEGRYLAH